MQKPFVIVNYVRGETVLDVFDASVSPMVLDHTLHFDGNAIISQPTIAPGNCKVALNYLLNGEWTIRVYDLSGTLLSEFPGYRDPEFTEDVSDSILATNQETGLKERVSLTGELLESSEFVVRGMHSWTGPAGMIVAGTNKGKLTYQLPGQAPVLTSIPAYRVEIHPSGKYILFQNGTGFNFLDLGDDEVYSLPNLPGLGSVAFDPNNSSNIVVSRLITHDVMFVNFDVVAWSFNSTSSTLPGVVLEDMFLGSGPSDWGW